MLKATIDQDLKAAMLSGDKALVEVLRNLKSAILYKEVADNLREEGLDDNAVIAVFKKEQKNRKDAIAIYEQAGDQARTDQETYQLEIIERYLPAEASESEVDAAVAQALENLAIDSPEQKDMGRIIGEVKSINPRADGALIASCVKKVIDK